jgi:hypothetical protein
MLAAAPGKLLDRDSWRAVLPGVAHKMLSTPTCCHLLPYCLCAGVAASQA